MKKRPVTWISIAALMVLLACLTLATLNSGLQYHELHAEAIVADEAELVSTLRQKMERANLLAVLHAARAVMPVFLLWYAACAFIIIRRMRAVGVKRAGERYGIALLIFVGGLWGADYLLVSRPAAYDYDEYMQCVLAAFGAECCGVLASALAIYFCCHLPWRKRVSH